MNHPIALVFALLLGFFPASEVLAEENPAASNAWPAYVEGLVPLGERMADQLIDPKDLQLRQEMYRYLYATMAQGYFDLIYQDPKYPDFWPFLNQAFNFLIPNPDDAYYEAAIEDSGIYKISGFRGTTRIVDFQIGSGELFPYGRGSPGPTLKNYDLDHDAHIRKDGSFELILSAERPKGYKGDWWKLDPKATFIWVRQISYDWVHEVDGRFAIERLDTPAIKPRDSAENIAEKLKQITGLTENLTRYALKWNATLHQRGLVNKVAVDDYSGQGGFKTQLYIQGVFDIQPDEALILETEVPKHCRYWNFHLTDELSASLDWLNRQTSLNGYTARLDTDGKFRAVISASDPGVPNWLDNAGYTRGTVFGRWKECSSYPQPTLKKVKVADIRQYLPADTPLVTAAARDAAIRLRRKTAQLRRRW